MNEIDLFSDFQYDGDIKEQESFLDNTNLSKQTAKDDFAKDVFGTDDRFKVTDTTKAFPKWICKLYMYPNSNASDQARRLGTATFVAPNVILTAGHNVHNNDLGGWASKIEVIPGLNGIQRPYGETFTSHYICCKGWIDTKRDLYDFALIFTQKQFPPQYGHMGFASVKKENLQGQNITICGYPVDLPRDQPGMKGKYQYYAKNNVLKLDSGMLYYTVDVEGGQSGSPIMYYNNERNQFYICGIHTAGKYGQITTNSGTYLTNIIYDIIQSAKQGKIYESPTDKSFSMISSK